MIRKHEIIETSGGVQVYIDVYSDSRLKGREALVFLPALGIEARYYQVLAESFVKQGYPVVVMELRGQGRSQLKPSRKVNFGYREIIEDDLLATIGYVKDAFPTYNIILSGHSLGGHIALLFSSRYSKKLSKVLLIACSTPYFKYYSVLKGAGIYLASLIFSLTAWELGYFPGHRLGFGGIEARQLIFEWGKLARTGKFILKGRDFDYENSLTSLKLPIYSITMATDTFAPLEANLALLSKLNSANIVRKELTPNQLELKKATHFNWVKKAAIVADHAVDLMNRGIRAEGAERVELESQSYPQPS